MKKIEVKDKNGLLINRAITEEHEEYINNCVQKNIWGQPECDELDENGNPTGNKIPAEYTIEIIDITQQVEQERINKESLDYLASTDWYVIREMDSGIPCPADIKAARAAARAVIIK